MLRSDIKKSTPDPLDLTQQRCNDDSDSSLELSIEDAMERLGMGPFQYKITVAAGLCFAADAMEILLLSFLSQVLKQEWQLTDTQASTITSSVFVGALLGSVILGPLGDVVGRRPIVILAASIISIFGLGTSMANSFPILLVLLFFVGFGVGGSTVPFDTLRSLLVPVLAYFFLEKSWRLFCVLCAVPCLFSSILSIMVVPESPRWLCARGRADEALVILQKAAHTNGHVEEIFPLDTVLTTEEEHSMICDLFSPTWKWITLRLWGVWLGYSVLYYGTILAITFIFSSNNEENDGYSFDYGAIFASSSAEVLGLTLVIFTVDSVGRIPSATVCYVLGGLCVFALCTLDSLGASHSLLLPCSFASRLFLMGATCLTWVSTSEILSTEIRSTGHSAANAIARIGGAASPYIISNGISLQVVGIIMLSISLVTGRLTWKLPETRGVAMGMAVASPKDHSSEHSAELAVALVPCNDEVV